MISEVGRTLKFQGGRDFLQLKEEYGNYKHYASGKVREIFRNEEDNSRIAVVTTDRVSAFDEKVGLIPDKGKILTGISSFWSIWIDSDSKMPYQTAFLGSNSRFIRGHNLCWSIVPTCFLWEPELDERITWMLNLDMFPIECIVRGHITGSAWKLYEQGAREFCGIKLPDGLKNGDPFPGGPIFTPTTKAASGHDENISFEEMEEILENNFMNDIGVVSSSAETVRDYCLDLYNKAYDFALDKGIIIADTKFELGFDNHGYITFGDEILTPDSSRFWDANKFEPGKEQESFDKQIIRDYMASNNTKDIPEHIIMKTREKYIELYEKIVGEKWS